MPDTDLVHIRLTLTGEGEVVAGSTRAAGAVKGVGTAATGAGAAAASAAPKTSRMTTALNAASRAARTTSLVMGGALAFGIFKSVGAYREAAKIGAQTNAVVKSTGRVANISAEGVANLADSLSKKTGLDDEAIQSATNLLLTFTKIRNEAGKGNNILDQTTAATLDLAAATGVDLTSASKQVGKALNDPTTGLTALRRSGASFNAEQTETIQGLFESGKRLEAQKLILAELNTEFRGSAKASTDAGDRMGVSMENLGEKLGAVLAPILEDVAYKISDFAVALGEGKVWALAIVGAIGAITIALGVFSAASAIAGAAGITMGLGVAIAWLLIPLAIAAIVIALIVAYHKVEWFRNFVDRTVTWIRDHWKLLVAAIPVLGPALLLIITQFGRIKGAAIGFIQWLVGAWGSIKGTLGGPFMWVYNNVLKPFFAWVAGKFQGLMDDLRKIGNIAGDVAGAAIPGGSTGIASDEGILGISGVPGLAAGGSLLGGGLTIIGERGPELLSLPAGSQVRPLQPTETQFVPAETGGAGSGGSGGRRGDVILDGRKVGVVLADVGDDEAARS